MRRTGCSLCTSQGPLSAITQNNRDSMVLADCAKYCSSLTQEEAEWLSRIARRRLYQLLCSSLVRVGAAARKQGGWWDYVWLIWVQLLVAPERQMREEAGMSRRCECLWLLAGWEGVGGRSLKRLLAGSQLEHDRHNLPDTRSAWLVVGLQSGCSGSLMMPAVLLWESAVAAVVVTACHN